VLFNAEMPWMSDALRNPTPATADCQPTTFIQPRGFVLAQNEIKSSPEDTNRRGNLDISAILMAPALIPSDIGLRK